MISFAKYGFKHQSAFRNARGVSEDVFDAMMTSNDWKLRKQALLHPDCPLRIRDHVRLNGVWYQRIVALMAKAAPANYWRHATSDPDKRVRNTYSNRVHYHSTILRAMLTKLNVIDEEEL